MIANTPVTFRQNGRACKSWKTSRWRLEMPFLRVWPISLWQWQFPARKLRRGLNQWVEPWSCVLGALSCRVEPNALPKQDVLNGLGLLVERRTDAMQCTGLVHWVQGFTDVADVNGWAISQCLFIGIGRAKVRFDRDLFATVDELVAKWQLYWDNSAVLSVWTMIQSIRTCAYPLTGVDVYRGNIVTCLPIRVDYIVAYCQIWNWFMSVWQLMFILKLIYRVEMSREANSGALGPGSRKPSSTGPTAARENGPGSPTSPNGKANPVYSPLVEEEPQSAVTDAAQMWIKFAKTFMIIFPIYVLGYFEFSFSWVLIGLAVFFWWRKNQGGKNTRLNRALAFLEHEEKTVRQSLPTSELPPWVSYIVPSTAT